MDTVVPAPVDWVESVSQPRLPAKADRRLQDLMDRNNEGTLTAEIVQHTKISDDGRLNELKTSIRIDLNRLTNKIESGFFFDVRTELPQNASPEVKEQAVAITQFRFEPIQGPRFELPETTEDSKEQPKKKKASTKKEPKA